MGNNLLKPRSLQQEPLTKKLAVSFFFMSIIPILLIMYLAKVIGYEMLENKLPYLRWTIFFTVCLVTVLFIFLRYSITAVSRAIKTAEGIAEGDYKKRIDVKDSDEVGKLARSFNKITNELETKIKELEESKDVIQDIFKKIGSAISTADGIEQLLELIVETMTKGVFAESGCIMMLNEKHSELNVEVSYGIKKDIANKISVKVGEGIIGLSVKEKRAIISSFADEPISGSKEKVQLYSKNLISVPLLYREDCLGALVVFNKKESANFNKDDKVLVSNIASQAAVALANAKLNKDAAQTYIETISALAIAVEAKDLYSRGHLDRVSRLVINFAKSLGLNEKTIAILQDGAKLHDLGKIGVRDYILCKKEPLTAEEQKELETHVIIGENIMRPIQKLQPLCEMVRHHQEWWDGTGYPDKLKGEKIPLTARILKVVDAYDAMSTDRPYRKALTKDKIEEEFKQGSGKEFDPKLVNKFLELI